MTLLAASLLVPLALLARLAVGRWLRPGAVFAAYWAVAGILPVLYFATPRVGVRAVVYIGVAMLLFIIGTVTATGARVEKAAPRPVPVLNRTVVMWTIWVGCAAGILAGLAALSEHGLSARGLLSLDGLLRAGNTIAVERYDGQGASPVISALLALSFAASVVAPFGRVLEPRISLWWVCAPTASTVFYSTVSTAKAALLIAGACTIGGYLAARTLREGDAPKVTRRGALVSALVVAAIVAVSAGAMFVRVGRVDVDTALVIKDKIGVYALGYEPAFSVWLESYEGSRWESIPLGWGTATVAGASVLVGQQRSDTRAYDEFATINDEGDSTNIYTIFRNLIIDFGTPGAAMVVYLWGLASGYAYRRTVAVRSLTAAVVLGCLYGVVLFSSVQSVVSFTNVLVGMVGAVVVLRWAARPAHQPAAERSPVYASRISR